MVSYQYVYVMDGVSKTYASGKQVLKDLKLSFFPNAKIGIVGVNGSGKSTVMKIAYYSSVPLQSSYYSLSG